MTNDSAQASRRPVGDPSVSNTDIVLVVLDDLGGAERRVNIEDIAEVSWQRVPARFSWPKLQRYPDLDAVDVTLRAAKKNERLVTGSKRDGWMLTAAGVERSAERRDIVAAFIERSGHAGRTENRRERGGASSSTTKRLADLKSSAAYQKYMGDQSEEISVYDFMAFFNINQYMPEHKYKTNRQALENLARHEPDILSVAKHLDERFGADYKGLVSRGGA